MATIEPVDASGAPGVEIDQQKYSAEKKKQGGAQDSISERTLVDRIKRSDRWMIVLTAVIALGGTVSAVIFGYQLAEMKVTAELTREAIKVSRETLIASQRAFVFAKEPNVGPIPPEFPGQRGVRLLLVWENSGNSPTVDLRLRTYCELRGECPFRNFLNRLNQLDSKEVA